MRGRRSIGIALAAAAVFAGGAAPAAQAADYEVFSCRTPQGIVAPTGDASGYGWQTMMSGHLGAVAADSCASGGGLSAELNLQYAFPIGAFAGWKFVAPADTSITAYDVRWSYLVHRNTFVGTTPSTGTAGGVSFDSQGTDMFDQASQASGNASGSAASPAQRSRSGVDASSLQAAARCTAPTCNSEPGASDAALTVYRSHVTLLDQSSPQVGTPGGEAVDRTTWAGDATVTFAATDAGGGVYRLLTKVDGATRVSQILDETSVRCRDMDPSNSDDHEFVHPRPCPLTTSGGVTVDTTMLPEGAHSVQLVVEDAAGNQATLYGPATKTVDNVPAPTNSALPTISGSPAVPRTLVGDRGTWDTHGLAATYTSQWERCDAAGVNCSDIAGAGGVSHDLTSADAYHRLVFRAVGATAEGSTSARSAPSAVIADAAGNTSPPGPGGVTGDKPGAAVSSAGNGQAVAVDTVTASGSRGALNGDNASDNASLVAFFDRTKAKSLVTRYGRRVVVRGRLLHEKGSSIGNARVEMLSTNAVAGAQTVDKGGVRTRQDGTWTLILPANVSSRTLTFRYRSHLGDDKVTAEQTLRLQIKASVRLRITPRVTRNGKSIRFTGRLMSRPVPVRGKLVELQARDAGHGRWITFKSLRTTRSGTFRARYTFRRTRGRVTYEFRARARYEGTYPYLAGTSNTVRVKVH